MSYALRSFVLAGCVSLLVTALPAQAETITMEKTIVKTTTVPDDADGMIAVREKLTRDLQAKLKGRGYDVDVTGNYDVKTANAVRAYQRDHGLTVTGEAEPALLTRLGVDTTIYSAEEVVDREVIRYRLGRRGSENANVYDGPNANRAGIPVFRPSNPPLSHKTHSVSSQAPTRGELNR